MTSPCRDCQRPVNYVRNSPLNLDGTPHRCRGIPMVPDHPTSHNGEDDSMRSYDARIHPPGNEPQLQGNNGSLSEVPARVNTNPNSNESIVRTVAERPDSIAIGTRGKGGEIKVYFDAGNIEDAEARVRNAFKVRDLVNLLHSYLEPVTLAERMQS